LTRGIALTTVYALTCYTVIAVQLSFAGCEHQKIPFNFRPYLYKVEIHRNNLSCLTENKYTVNKAENYF